VKLLGSSELATIVEGGHLREAEKNVPLKDYYDGDGSCPASGAFSFCHCAIFSIAINSFIFFPDNGH
jgi:hypothetical protein